LPDTVPVRRKRFSTFKRRNFHQLRRIAARRVVPRVKPNIHQRPRFGCGNHILPHTQHLCVIIFYRTAHAHQIMRRGCADALHLVGGNRRADARTSNQNGAVGFPCGNFLRSSKRKRGIRQRLVRQIVQALDTRVVPQMRFERVFQNRAVGWRGND